MRTASLPGLVGDTERLMKIQDEEDGSYLVLSFGETMKGFGEDRLVVVRWRRFPNNQSSTPPEKKSKV